MKEKSNDYLMSQREAITDRMRLLELNIKQSEDMLAHLGHSLYSSEPHLGSECLEKNSGTPNPKGPNENAHSSKGSEEAPDRVSSFDRPNRDFELALNPVEGMRRTQSFTQKGPGKGRRLELRKQVSTPGPRIESVGSAHQSVSPETIDIAIVYTSPLVEAVEKNQTQFTQLLTCDDYDFCDDVYQYVSLIKKTKFALRVLIERISIDQFIKVLEKQPRVLHLLCHCDWDQEKGEYYLCFQNEKLELLKVSYQKLESMIKMVATSLSNIGLLILSAPFAEVAPADQSFVHLFRKLGVASVIHINDQHRVKGSVCGLFFCKAIYSKLLSPKKERPPESRADKSEKLRSLLSSDAAGPDAGSAPKHSKEKSVSSKPEKSAEKERLCSLSANQLFEEVLESAVKSIEPREVLTCCCLHAHSKTCPVYSRLRVNQDRPESVGSAHQIHRLHLTSLCPCPESNLCKHDMNCPKFVQKVIKRELKMNKKVNLVIDENPSADYTCYMLCCCRPEVPHDLRLLFRLFHCNNHRELGDLPLFQALTKGSLEFQNQSAFKEPMFKRIFALGMEKILHTLYISLVENRNRVVLLAGVVGSGKASASKKLCNILLETHKVTAVKYVNMTGISDLDILVSRIFWMSNLGNKKSYLENLQQDDVTLVVLENINLLLEADSDRFLELVKNLLERTKYKFLIIGEFHDDQVDKTDSKLRALVEEVFYMPAVSRQKAVRLLQVLTNGGIMEDVAHEEELLNHPLLGVKQPGQKLTPKRIADIAYFWKSDIPLDEIEEILDQETLGVELNTVENSKQQMMRLM